MIDVVISFFFVFFFKQKTAYEMRISDWSSDVCSSDLRILRHEAIYLQAAAASGLRTIATRMWRETMLFLPRFDRLVDGNGVTRVHQETLAALIGAPGFGRSASMFALTERRAAVATAPGVEVAEFLCRDVLNRALRNPDNHLRNTSVQQLPD